MTHEESEAREAVALVCRRLWERGLVAGQDGNVSVRLESGRILITPAGFSKVDVCPQHLVALADDGTWDGGPLVPSSESALHLRAYARRPDIGAVVHAHPVWATALGLAGGSLPENVLPEITVLLGTVPLVPYGTPGTPTLADQFDTWWAGHDVFLMANHGALTLGRDLRTAHQRMETLEHAVQVVTCARGLGPVRELSREQVDRLRAARAARAVE